jgi:hypothetical protein
MVQSPMALGSLFLFIAMLDSFRIMLLGQTPQYVQNEDELSSSGVE